MGKSVLDKTDLDILAILGRDSRASYNSIGSIIGLTSKSVKARVKNMLSSGVIDKFVVRVNPTAFGYRTTNVVIKTSNGTTKDDVIRRVRKFGDLAFHAHQMGRNTAAAIITKEPFDANAIAALNDWIKPATVDGISISHVPVTMDLSETDLQIIRCLIHSGARLEIGEIAKQLGISEKTAARRLERMKEERMIDFTLQCNPASMVGYVQFCIIMFVAKSHYRSVYERMYSEFQESILYRPSVIDPEDRLVFVLFGDNVFKVDSVLTKVDSFEGVKMAEAFIVTKLQYYDDWAMREIEKRLLPMSRKSMALADTLNA